MSPDLKSSWLTATRQRTDVESIHSIVVLCSNVPRCRQSFGLFSVCDEVLLSGKPIEHCEASCRCLLQRYYHYIHHGIPDQHLAPFPDSFMREVRKLLPHRLQSVHLADLFAELEREVSDGYKLGLRKGIREYTDDFILLECVAYSVSDFHLRTLFWELFINLNFCPTIVCLVIWRASSEVNKPSSHICQRHLQQPRYRAIFSATNWFFSLSISISLSFSHSLHPLTS